jgi:hypothetical protein
MTEPLGLSMTSPAVQGNHSDTAGVMFTVQTETLGYKRYLSTGGKAFAGRQWSDWRGLEVRGTVIETSLGGLGGDPGNNHTVAITVGPRIEHSFGRLTPYGEIAVGFLHQYYYGSSEGAAFGASLRIHSHWSWIPADAEYRYASLQESARLVNPRRGRIELSSGLTYTFDK